MTREEFIELLKKNGYSYEIEGIEGNKIVVKEEGYVNLKSLVTLPPGVEFKNRGYVNLGSLETIPPGVEFKNGGNVYLESLLTLPPGVEFKNEGHVNLGSLKTLPSGVEFNNEGTVYLESLVGGFFDDWKGNIKGIGSKSLLNLMIKRELFI